MKKVEKFIKLLNLDKEPCLNIITARKKYIYDIEKNFDTTLYLAETLLLCSKYDRTKFFISNISAFEKASEVLNLASNIEKVFSIPFDTALNTSIKIASDDEMLITNFCENVLSVFEKFTQIQRKDLITFISKTPHILALNMKVCYRNFYVLSTKFKVEYSTLRKLFVSLPLFFSKPDLISSVGVISKCLELSSQELNAFLCAHYNICLAPVNTIRKNIASLIYMFGYSDYEVNNLVRANPQVLLIPKNTLFNLSRSIMRTFSISEKQVKNMFFKYPKLITISSNIIIKKYKQLINTNLFVKRDIKDIVLSTPQILTTPIRKISNNILKISSQLYLTKPIEVTKLIRQCPNILLCENVSDRIKTLISYQIPRAYIRIAPAVLSSCPLLTGVKHAILKTFDLSYELDNVTSIDIQTLSSRIKFLSENKKPIKDLTLSPSMFEFNHKISTDNLHQDYKPTLANNLALISMASRIMKKTKHTSQILSFFNPNLLESLKLSLSLTENDGLNSTIKNQKEISLILSRLGLDDTIIKYILQITPNYISSADVLSVIEILLSYHLSREQIINIILRKPIIISSAPNSLRNFIHESAFECNYNVRLLEQLI